MYCTISVQEKPHYYSWAPSSHITHTATIGSWCFSPLKNSFIIFISKRIIASKKDAFNDVLKICELLCKSYHESVTATNIIGGFSGSGLWCANKCGLDIEQIRDISYISPNSPSCSLTEGSVTRSRVASIESSAESAVRVENAKQLYKLFRNKQKS